MAKILVADDERDIRELIGFTLQLAGHSIVYAVNGEEAVRLARLEKPDLLLLDYRMPVMPGSEAAERLRADPETALIPVIFLTAREQDSSIAGQIAQGAYFLSKPFSIDQLTRLVESTLTMHGRHP